MNPSKFYNNYLETQAKLQTSLSKKSSLFSIIRIIVFLVFITGIIYYLNERAIQPALIGSLLLVIVLAALIKLHNKLKASLVMSSNLVKLSTLEIEKLKGNFNKIDEGNEFINDNHPYSSDLDFFGPNSIFQLITQTTSFFGKQKLALWLLNKASKQEILKRQKAAQELSTNQSWTLEYRATGLSDQLDEKQITSFKNWLHKQPRLLGNGFLKTAVIVLPGLVVLISSGAFIFNYTLWAGLPLFIISGYLLSKQHKYATKTVEDTFRALSTLDVLSKQLSILSNSPFKSNYLTEIKEKVGFASNAGKEINRLHKFLDNLQSRNSMMHVFVNIPFMLDIVWLLKLEAWKKENAEHVEQWFESLATAESLISLSGLYFNKPNWATPVFSDKDYFFKAEDLTHPLLKEDGVSNQFSFEGKGRTNLITGPNMAGKSTFLRTVATSVVFAQIGAPVRAKAFVINPTVQVFTAMRVKDNLSESVSSFYAELDRIKQLIDNVKSGQSYLYFLDEILKGTNSADRHKGAEALIRQLNKLEASGFISTHDLALGELASKENFVQNFSFESDISNGQITFDYTIKEGICTSFNACELMRQMGIEVN